MIPHVAPPVWPQGIRKGRFASAIVPNELELREEPGARDIVAKCQVGLLGLPDDTGVELNAGRPGAKAGPAAFRAALAKYGVASPADEPIDAPVYPRVFDCGDIVIGKDIHETHDRISEAVGAIIGLGLFPIAVGGGHDLTFAFVRGVARVLGEMSGLYIDAHLDVRPEVGSGMPFRSLMEGGFASGLTCLGLNPLVNSREHAEYFRSKGGQIIAMGEPFEPAELTPFARRGFVSLDMDAFDASIAPGVSALNPCGFLGREIEPVIRWAGRSAGVRCFDIMELNPVHDQDGRTARLAAHMFLTFLRGFAERRQEPIPSP